METNTIYDVAYFINKFEAINSSDIGIGNIASHCSLYHCGLTTPMMYEHPPEEAKQLNILFSDNKNEYLENKLLHNYKLRGEVDLIWMINDDKINAIIHGDTPKERILNYLYQIRDKQS